MPDSKAPTFLDLLSTQCLSLFEEEAFDRADTLSNFVDYIFNDVWCSNNMHREFQKNNVYHPLSEDSMSGGGGVTKALCSSIVLASDYFDLEELKHRVKASFRNPQKFEATLFELSILGALAAAGIEILEFDYETKYGDVEALVRHDGVEILVECKLLTESDSSKLVEDFINFDIPEPINAGIFFKKPPDQQMLDDLRLGIIEKNEGFLPCVYDSDLASVTLCEPKDNEHYIEYGALFTDEKRHKNTLLKAIKKLRGNKGRKLWLFVGAGIEARQQDAIDGFTSLVQEKRYADKLYALTFVDYPYSMEPVYYKYTPLFGEFDVTIL